MVLGAEHSLPSGAAAEKEKPFELPTHISCDISPDDTDMAIYEAVDSSNTQQRHNDQFHDELENHNTNTGTTRNELSDKRNVGSSRGSSRCSIFLLKNWKVLFLIVVICVGIVVISLSASGNMSPNDGNDVTSGAQVGTGSGSGSAPTYSPTTSIPTISPTTNPTSYAFQELHSAIVELSGYDVLEDNTSPQHAALMWLVNDDPKAMSLSKERLIQRYSLAAIHFSLTSGTGISGGSKRRQRHLEVQPTTTTGWLHGKTECRWPGIVCGHHHNVTEITLLNMGLDGRIPPEIGNFKQLTKLDLAENQIHGPIPEKLYDLVNLEYLYLNQNMLTGSLSDRLGELVKLRELYVGQNDLDGTLPLLSELSELKFLSLHKNKFSGPIPSNMKFKALWYLDLSYNRFNGTLPDDVVQYSRLHFLYLDHNQFVGPIHEGLSEITNMFEFHLNDNQFTGGCPSSWGKDNFHVQTIKVQNNNLTQNISESICDMWILRNWNELVELGVDCEICTCCDACQCCDDIS